MTQHFLKDHDDLRALMRGYPAGVRNDAADRAMLLRDRVAFSQLFRRHLADEDAQIRNVLGNDPLAVRAAADMQRIFRDYSAHLSQWTPPRIEGEWGDYCRAVLALQRRLIERLAWEERELFPRLATAQAA